jgi:hypothetical protein
MRASRLLASLACLLSACTGASADDPHAFEYIGNGSGQFDVRFVSPDDRLLIVERESRTWDGTARLFDADGIELWHAPLDGLRMTAMGEFALADESHIVLPRLRTSPPGYAVVPIGSELSGPTHAFSTWVVNVGGLRGEGHRDFAASTNPFANQSCALGADGSSVAWLHGDAGSFSAAPPRTVPGDVDSTGNPSGGFHFVNLFCLIADDRQFIAVTGLEKAAPVGRKSVVLIYESGQTQPIARFNITFEGHEALPHFRQVSTDTLVGLDSISDPERNWADRPWMATRITFRNGSWQVEQALLSETPSQWQREFRVMDLGRDRFWFVSTDRVFSVVWPDRASVIPFTPVEIIAAQSEFERSVLESGEILVSPSGDRIAWVDRRGGGEVRVSAIPTSLRTRE